jgi:hypothetical protein
MLVHTVSTLDAQARLSSDLPWVSGSYSGAGYFLSTMASNESVGHYSRWLDLDDGIHHTNWSLGTQSFSRFVSVLWIGLPAQSGSRASWLGRHCARILRGPARSTSQSHLVSFQLSLFHGRAGTCNHSPFRTSLAMIHRPCVFEGWPQTPGCNMSFSCARTGHMVRSCRARLPWSARAR